MHVPCMYPHPNLSPTLRPKPTPSPNAADLDEDLESVHVSRRSRHQQSCRSVRVGGVILGAARNQEPDQL